MSLDQAIERFLGDRLGLSASARALAEAARRWVAAEAVATGASEDDVIITLERERGGAAWHRFVTAVTITHSYFFRDLDQLEGVLHEIERVVLRRGKARIWSAACAGGEEVWSLAMMAKQAGLPVEIVGTDVDADAIARGDLGRYGRRALRSFPASMRDFVTVHGDELQVSDALRDSVRFEVANLVQPVRRGTRFDVIVCRNALLYFTADGKKRAAATFLDALDDDATLWIGAAESLRGLLPGLKMEVHGHRVCYVRRAADEVAVPEPTRAVRTEVPAAPPSRQSSPSVSLDPRDALQLAIAHRQGERWEPASDALRRALFLAPDFWPASWLLAATAARLGDTRTQLRELDRTLRLLHDPAAAASYSDLLEEIEPEDVREACQRGLARQAARR